VDIRDIPLTTIDGESASLSDYADQVVMVVNVASRCGLTPQYEKLEELQREYGERGFTVLGFPCNQFGSQEPGTEAEIRGFCDLQYGVTFPLFAKIDVNGEHAHPLYRYLKSAKKGLLGRESIAWNFTKFLIGRDGAVLQRYGPRRKPEAIDKDVAAVV
jgi:glutathione peroxidase